FGCKMESSVGSTLTRSSWMFCDALWMELYARGVILGSTDGGDTSVDGQIKQQTQSL
ncbi:hypothetical protein MKX01_024303, partial [Papaver californicum]